MKTTQPKRTAKKTSILSSYGWREVFETVVAAVVFGSIVAIVVLPVTNAVAPWGA